jgi:hypothetical protein
VPSTVSEAPFLSNPYTWLFLSALFFGAAVARVTRRTSRARDPERAWTVKWVFFCLYLSASLALALGALFIGRGNGLRQIGALYFFLACALLFFLAFRFRKSAGALFLFLLLAVVLATLLFLQSLRAFTGETEIARLRVLSSRGDAMVLELLPAEGEPVVARLKGGYFAPLVRVVIFEDYFVFLGAKSWYRFEGLLSFESRLEGGRSVLRQTDTAWYFPEAPGISERLYDWFEEHERQIPGVKTVQIEAVLKRARDLSSYSIRVQNDGGVEVVPVE